MTYIHPNDAKIADFAQNIARGNSLREICSSLLNWFEENVAYSRLNAPFAPLQRSDLDVLSMCAGTCGDYANLIVSVLTHLGYETAYAYVQTDCYGHAQDHICAAVRYDARWVLIDATQPYRKWHGFDCPHRAYELLSCEAFETKMKSEEAYWLALAQKHKKEKLAGLYYAPWIHEQCVQETETLRDSVFYLLILEADLTPVLYIYYQRYTEDTGHLPMMAVVREGETSFRFSIHPCEQLWDEAQWGDAYTCETIPETCKTQEYTHFLAAMEQTVPLVWKIVEQAK